MIEAKRKSRGLTPRERRAAQDRVRAVEMEARRSALVTCRLGTRLRVRREEAALRLGISRRTLSAWETMWSEHRGSRPRGRPPLRLRRADHLDVLAFLLVVGPRVSLDSLRGQFPEHPPAALDALRMEFRLASKRSGTHYSIRALRWTRPGWVWAMDFAKPPQPIDGTYPRVLLVRDLSSGKQLAALPCPDEKAMTVWAVLRVLFHRFGVPLVIKSDNGSAFRDEDLKRLVLQSGAIWLFSPPCVPAYNGSCEAGVGSIKTRAHHEAARHDRPYLWTSDDLEAARCQANETARPRGWRGPTPDESFHERTPVSDAARREFRDQVRALGLDERSARGIASDAALDHYAQASIDRVAIGRALSEQGHLEFRRRRISLPFRSHSRAKIT